MGFKELPDYEEIDIERDSVNFGKIDRYALYSDREETCYRGKSPDVLKRTRKAQQTMFKMDYASNKPKAIPRNKFR